MPERYYLDTCIWIDYFENRQDRFRPLGEWAFRFIKKIIENNDKIIISDHLINELNNRFSSSKVEECLSILPQEIRVDVAVIRAESGEAFFLMKKYKLHFEDALHAVIAKRNNAVFVTRDLHFYVLQKYVSLFKPEELI